MSCKHEANPSVVLKIILEENSNFIDEELFLCFLADDDFLMFPVQTNYRPQKNS